MGRHTGKNGVVKLGGDTLVALTGFDIDETVGTQDVTACGDPAEVHATDIPGWSGSIKMNVEHGEAGQTLRAGDAIQFEGYSEGAAAGKTYYSGPATIESMKFQSEVRGVVTREYSIKGNGPLTMAVAS